MTLATDAGHQVDRAGDADVNQVGAPATRSSTNLHAGSGQCAGRTDHRPPVASGPSLRRPSPRASRRRRRPPVAGLTRSKESPAATQDLFGSSSSPTQGRRRRVNRPLRSRRPRQSLVSTPRATPRRATVAPTSSSSDIGFSSRFTGRANRSIVRGETGKPTPRATAFVTRRAGTRYPTTPTTWSSQGPPASRSSSVKGRQNPRPCPVGAPGRRDRGDWGLQAGLVDLLRRAVGCYLALDADEAGQRPPPLLPKSSPTPATDRRRSSSCPPV